MITPNYIHLPSSEPVRAVDEPLGEGDRRTGGRTAPHLCNGLEAVVITSACTTLSRKFVHASIVQLHGRWFNWRMMYSALPAPPIYLLLMSGCLRRRGTLSHPSLRCVSTQAPNVFVVSRPPLPSWGGGVCCFRLALISHCGIRSAGNASFLK